MSNYALSSIFVSLPWGLFQGEKADQLTLRIVFVIIMSELAFRVWQHFYKGEQA